MTFYPHWPMTLAGRTSLLLLITALVVYLGAIFGYRALVERAAGKWAYFSDRGSPGECDGRTLGAPDLGTCHCGASTFLCEFSFDME